MRGTVVVIACQHCRTARTVLLGLSIRFCFNCRRACERTPANLPSPHVFTTTELRRMATYQVAIQAGVYADRHADLTRLARLRDLSIYSG